jgi:hypothetical protein
MCSRIGLRVWGSPHLADPVPSLPRPRVPQDIRTGMFLLLARATIYHLPSTIYHLPSTIYHLAQIEWRPRVRGCKAEVQVQS